MMTNDKFIDALMGQGFDFFTGVPCSILKKLIPALTERGVYYPCVREDAAVGLASGVWMGGRKPVILMQNSGLGYCLNALTSLNLIYKIPSLLVISWRGYLGKDAPEHIIMGEVFPKILDVIGVPRFTLEPDNMEETVASAASTIDERSIPVAILLRKGVLS